MMKRNRIRTALKGAERRRGKKKPFIFRYFTVPMLNLVGKSFMFQRVIEMPAGTPSLWTKVLDTCMQEKGSPRRASWSGGLN